MTTPKPSYFLFLVTITICACIFYSCNKKASQLQIDGDLYIYKHHGKYGYIDNNGSIIIEAQFDEAEDFEYGSAVIIINNNAGLINAKGEIIITPQFKDIYQVDSTRLKIQNKSGLFGLIDINGVEILKDTFKYINEIYNTKLVRTEYSIFDLTGKIVFNQKCYRPGFVYSDGLIQVMYDNCNKQKSDFDLSYWQKTKEGFIDTSGVLVIKPIYEDVSEFSNGLAAVSINGKYGYIDKKGMWIISPQYIKADPFSEGLAAVAIEDVGEILFGYINTSGEMIIKPQFAKAESFDGNFAKVYIGNTSSGIRLEKIGGEDEYNSGFIDKLGNFVITPLYREFVQWDNVKGVGMNYNFYISDNGLINLRNQNGKWGALDTTGKHVIEFKYDILEHFYKGYANFMIDGKWGIIDSTGKVIISAKYNDLESFNQNGLTKFEMSEYKFGYINPSGKVIWEN